MSQQDLAKSLQNNKAYKRTKLYQRDHFLYMDDAIISAYAKDDETKAAVYSAIKQKGTSKIRGLNNPSKGYLLRFGSYNSAARWLHKTLKDVDLGHVGTTGAMGAMRGKLGSSRARAKMPVLKALGSAVSKQNTRVLEVISEAIPGVNVEFIKEVSDKAIKGNYKYQIVMPQSVDLNRKQIKEIETVYNNEVKRIAKTILTQKGSKSILQLTDAAIDAAIKGGKIPTSKTRSKTTIKSKVTKKTIPLPRLRDRKGQFTSAASIQKIIQSQLTEKIKDNMGTVVSFNNS